MRSLHEGPQYGCGYCWVTCARVDNLRVHVKSFHHRHLAEWDAMDPVQREARHQEAVDVEGYADLLYDAVEAGWETVSDGDDAVKDGEEQEEEGDDQGDGDFVLAGALEGRRLTSLRRTTATGGRAGEQAPSSSSSATPTTARVTRGAAKRRRATAADEDDEDVDNDRSAAAAAPSRPPPKKRQKVTIKLHLTGKDT